MRSKFLFEKTMTKLNESSTNLINRTPAIETKETIPKDPKKRSSCCLECGQRRTHSVFATNKPFLATRN